MRILYVSGERLNKFGGTPLRIREIATQWIRQGHAVVTLAPSYAGGRPRDWPTALELVRLPSRSLASFALLECSMAHHVARVAKMHDSQVVLSTGGVLSPLVYRALKARKIPYVVEINGMADVEARLRPIPKPLAHAYAWAIRNGGLYRRADLFVCVAEGIRAELSERWPPFASRSVTIQNGVNPARFAARDRSQCRRELGLPNGDFIFGFVGLLCPWHGTEDLIAATRILRERGVTGFRAVVVGGGERFESLREQARREGVEDLVVFTGRVGPEVVPLYTAAVDVACQVHNDPVIGRLGNSMKFWEYLASGLPVIMSDMSEAVRYVGRGVEGWVYRGGDRNDLADTMQVAMGQRASLAAMGAANRRFIDHGHRWEDVARAMTEALVGLVGRTSRA